MKTLTIRHIPEALHRALKIEALDRGVTLQAVVLERLQQAPKPTKNKVA
jgi:hypothetical protein